MNDPLDFIISFFGEKEKLFDHVEIELSYYEYLPQTVLDKRKILKLECIALNREDLEEILVACPAGHEVAIHSKFTTTHYNKKQTFHLPMIDFNCEIEMIGNVVSSVRKILPEKIWKTLYFYNSGRSIHAYSLSPIKPAEFFDFMGRCLLMNLPNESSLVDARWVGHRIMAGYASLRISHNTNNYLAAPKYMGTVADYI